MTLTELKHQTFVRQNVVIGSRRRQLTHPLTQKLSVGFDLTKTSFVDPNKDRPFSFFLKASIAKIVQCSRRVIRQPSRKVLLCIRPTDLFINYPLFFVAMAEAMIPGHSQEGEPAGQTPPQKEEASDATTKPNANQQITDSPVKKVSHDERTVVIHIPSKRQKQSPDVKTRSVIEAISSSISPNERREALSSAILIFDHNMQSLHDEELELGADSVLVKHLGYLFSRKQTSGRKPSMERLIVNEMSVTCEALEMVLRASPSAVSQSFHRFGAEVLDLLIHLMDEETEKRRTDAPSHKSQSSDGETGDESSVKVEVPDNSEMSPSLGSVASSVCAGYCEEAGRHEADVLLRKASKTLGHFARVGAATKPMAYHPGLLPCLLKSLLMPIEVIPSETRLNSLWILANLACNADK